MASSFLIVLSIWLGINIPVRGREIVGHETREPAG